MVAGFNVNQPPRQDVHDDIGNVLRAYDYRSLFIPDYWQLPGIRSRDGPWLPVFQEPEQAFGSGTYAG